MYWLTPNLSHVCKELLEEVSHLQNNSESMHQILLPWYFPEELKQRTWGGLSPTQGGPTGSAWVQSDHTCSQITSFLVMTSFLVDQGTGFSESLTQLKSDKTKAQSGPIPSSRLQRHLSGEESACQCRRLGFHPSWEDPWRRKWQLTPVFLPGKSHGWRRLADYSPWGHKKLSTT